MRHVRSIGDGIALTLAAAALSGCAAKLDYDPPASLGYTPGSREAAAVAGRRVDAALAERGDFHPGDLVRLSFPFLPSLDSSQRVQPSGLISPPLLSPISTAGVTASQLQQQLRALYTAKLERPEVVVSLLEYNRAPAPPEYFVLGEVLKPGAIAHRDGATLFEGIARAGGANRQADLGSVVVMEPDGDAMKARMVDLQGLLNGRDPSGTVDFLKPFSILIVPPNTITRTADRNRAIMDIIGLSGLNLGSRVNIP